MVAEWFDTFQYIIKKCRSQDEEMSPVGALCYGSLFLCIENLLLHITKHHIWVILNENRPKPIIIDMVIKPFRGSSKSVIMIFVRAECSKKDDARHALEEINDGSVKAYPRGKMLFFMPIMSKLDEDYTPQQCDKFIFNHVN
jgi:hypothetical protein